MRIALTSLVLIIIATAKTIGAEGSGTETEGKAILENHCARCHSIGASGESPLRKAPPLGEIYLRFPIEQLSQGLAEGMGSRHREMPQIQFSTDEVAAILNYLGNVTGIAPAERAVIQPGDADRTDPP
jgi:mono/diheme cytochrome c family protein